MAERLDCAPAYPTRSAPVCQQCDEIQVRIDTFRRALSQRFDPLTTQRLEAGLAEMEAKMRIPIDVAQDSEMISPTIPI